jgi:hypothetical protein
MLMNLNDTLLDEDSKELCGHIDSMAEECVNVSDAVFNAVLLNMATDLFNKTLAAFNRPKMSAELAFDIFPFAWERRVRLAFPNMSGRMTVRDLQTLDDEEREAAFAMIKSAISEISDISGGFDDFNARLSELAAGLFKKFLELLQDAPTAARVAYSVFPMSWSLRVEMLVESIEVAGHA